MSIFGWLTGGSDAAGKVVDSAISAGDKLFYTDEEKADNNQKINAFYLRYLEATAPQNLARRIIALIVTMLWALLVIVGVIVEAWGGGQQSEYIFKILDDVVNAPFITIITFYFLKRIISKGGS